MLCSRSASLTTITRMSFAEARIILRKVSACASSRRTYSWRPILVTPSTSPQISLPNSFSSTSRLVSVSSSTSCSSPTATQVWSNLRSASR